jgi:hypothetical protein
MTTCIPRAQGVPGLATAPNWFDSGPGSPPLRNTVDDPRWTGAYNRGYGYGTGLEAQFRGLYMAPDWRGKTGLFLQWEVVYDGALNNGVDRLYVGFNNGGAAATDTLLLKVVAYNNSGADIVDGAAGSIQALTLNPVTGIGTALANNPNWVNHARVWLTRTPISWAINLYVPYDPAAAGLYSDAGIKLPDPFKLFYEIYVSTPTRQNGGDAVGGLVVHKWPLTAANVFTGLNGDVYPHPPSDASQWDAFHLSAGPGDPNCTGTGGVSIDYSGLGNMVDGGAPNIAIKYSQTNPRPVNTLFANIDNQTGADIPAGGITARFRIADWGSVIMDPNAPWDDVRGGGSVSNAAPIPMGLHPVSAGNPPPLHFNWTLNDAELTPYLAGKPSDQCILVELSGAGITFFSDSARRNHLIQKASEVRKTARISIEGLAPIPGGGPNRDVYLAVETVNMPASSKEGNQTMRVWDDAKLALLRRREFDPDTLEILVNRGLTAALDSRELTLDSIIEMLPTYRVHVYHDSGEHLTVNGVDYPILAPQTSFGMLLDHVGDFYGWEHDLSFPPGVLQEKITPTFLRIHVPNNGKVKAHVRIQAVEPGDTQLPPPDKFLFWLWLLFLTFMITLALLV